MPAANRGDAAEAIGPPARRRLAGFMRTLRDNGFAVGLAETRDALAVLASPAAARPESLRPALRALLCSTHADWERFDEIFDAYWRGRGIRRVATAGTPSDPRSSRQGTTDAAAMQATAGRPDNMERTETAGGDAADRQEHRRDAAAAERLAAMDLRHVVDPAEIAKVHALAVRLAHRMRARLVRQPRQDIVANRAFESAVMAADANFNSVLAAFDDALNRVLKGIVEWTLTSVPPERPGRRTAPAA